MDEKIKKIETEAMYVRNAKRAYGAALTALELAGSTLDLRARELDLAEKKYALACDAAVDASSF